MSDIVSLISLASEVGIAIFTAVVAILEVARFLQGPDVSFLIGKDKKVYAKVYRNDNPPHNYHSTFRIPVVISNSGSRGGVVAELELQMIQPSWQIGPTIGNGSIDKIVVDDWRFDRGSESVFSGTTFPIRANETVSIRDNESVGTILNMSLILSNDTDKTKPPTYTFRDLEKQIPIFEFAIHYKTVGGRIRRSLAPRKKAFTIRPHFVSSEDEIPPSWMMEKKEGKG